MTTNQRDGRAPDDDSLALLALARVSQGQHLHGDVVGSLGSNTVVGIEGVPISGPPTIAGQILVFNGTEWVPSFGPSGIETAHTIHEGETYTLIPTDVAIIFDTSGGPQATATADMLGPSITDPWYIGREWLFSWFEWGNLQTPPTIVAPAGILMVPFSGRAASGVAGLVSSTVINTPGASWTLRWNGTYLARI